MSKKVPHGDGLHDFYKPHFFPAWMPEGPSLTRQEFAADCDINTIMERYDRTGMWPANEQEPLYLDCTVMPADLQSAMAMMQHAEDRFMTLPAAVRREFDNDPIKFVEYASDPDNLDQMRKWNLAPPAEEPLADRTAAPDKGGASSGGLPAVDLGPSGGPPKAP